MFQFPNDLPFYNFSSFSPIKISSIMPAQVHVFGLHVRLLCGSGLDGRDLRPIQRPHDLGKHLMKAMPWSYLWAY